MSDKTLFMILGDEIKFLPKDSTMDHREWFLSLGGTEAEYEKIIRGYIIKNYIIFFRANLSYDSEVIDVATVCGPVIKQQLNRPELKVCCGIEPGHDGTSWEPVVMLKGYGLDGVEEKQKSRLEEQTIEEEPKEEGIQKLGEDTPLEPIIEFNNDFRDPEFIKYATKFNVIILIATVITKVLMLLTEKIIIGDRWSTLLIIAQIATLIASIIGYNKQIPKAKYIGLGAAVSLFFMFDFIDIILGILVLFFTIDHTYIIKLMSFIDKYKKIGLEKMNSMKKNTPKNNNTNNEHQVIPELNSGQPGQIPNQNINQPTNINDMYNNNNQNNNIM